MSIKGKSTMVNKSTQVNGQQVNQGQVNQSELRENQK